MPPFPVFSFVSQIRGVRLYSGYDELQDGRVVDFYRERTNFDDRNAISVWLGRDKIGHVHRDVARVLSASIDDSLVTINGYFIC